MKKRNKRILWFLIGVLLVIIIAFPLVIANMAVNMLVNPNRDTSHNPEKAYAQLFEELPPAKAWVDSLNARHALKDTFIIAADGRRLHAVYAAANHPTDKTAFIIHGWTDSAIRMMRYGYMFQHDLGYNMFLPDLNGHGLSDGKYAQMGWLDRLDVIEWLDVANAIFAPKDSLGNKLADTQMVIHGTSMGAATAMCVSGEEQKPFVKAYIEDCGYTSVWDEFASELDKQFGLPTFPLLHTASGLCKIIYGWSFGEAAPVESVKNCRKPLLIIHGDADTYVPTEMGLRIYDTATCEKEIWLTKDVKHAKSYRNDPEAYTRRIDEFTRKHM